MPYESADLLTPGEAAAVAGVPIKAVYKTVGERLPKASLVRRSGQTFLTPTAVLCVLLDYELPKDVPIKVRRFVYEELKKGASGRVEYGSKLFSYVVDTRPAAAIVEDSMRRYQKAMQMIVENPEIQGGVATFKGTRLIVHHIAALLDQGVPEAELGEDYPNLTPAMIAAARIFAQAHPRRGRPRKPAWRASRPLTTEVARRRIA
jgi:uncharacterized protein (DUF433 family)